MNFLNRIFNGDHSMKICPRCLGKGHVDLDDIKRLGKELKWNPGTCAYCNGIGKVDSKIESNVPVDTTYLVTNLSVEERDRIINGNPDALERAHSYDDQVDDFIDQICYLVFEAGLTPTQVAEFYLLPKRELDSYQEEKQEFIEYVEQVVKVKRGED